MDPIAVSPADGDAWIGKAVTSMAFTAGEDAVIAWREHGPDGWAIRAASKPKLAGVSAPQLLGGGYNYPTVSPVGANSALVSWIGKAGEPGPGEDVLVSELTPDRSFAEPEVVARTSSYYNQPGAAVAGNTSGAAIVVYVEGYDGGNRVMSVRRSPEGEWGEPVALSTSLGANVWRVDVHMAETGEAVAAWYSWYPSQGRRAWSAVIAPDGTPADARLMNNESGEGGAPKIAMDRLGNAVITWPEVPRNGWAGPIRAAVKAPGQPFGKAIPIAGSTSSDLGAEVRLAQNGQAVLAWSSQIQTSDNGGYIDGVEVVAGQVPAGLFGAVQDISGGLADYPVTLGIDPVGNAAIFFRDWDTNEQRVVRRSVAGRLGQARPVIPCGPRRYGAWAAAAHVDALGDASLLWVDYSFLREAAPMFLSQDRGSLAFAPEPCPPPPPFLTWAPKDPRPGETVRFDGSGAKDPDATVTEFSWDLDGDGSFELGPTEDPHAEHVYEKAGEHRLGFQVYEVGTSGNSSTITCTYTVRVGLPPVPAETSSDPDGWDPAPPDRPEEAPWPFGPGPTPPPFGDPPSIPVYSPQIAAGGLAVPTPWQGFSGGEARLGLSLAAPSRRGLRRLFRRGLAATVTSGTGGKVRLRLTVRGRRGRSRALSRKTVTVRAGQPRSATLTLGRTARRVLRSSRARSLVLEARTGSGLPTQQRVQLVRPRQR